MKHDADLNAIFRAGVDVAYGNRGGEVYALYLQLFAALPFALRTPNRVFLSHSLPSATALADFDPAALEAEPTRPPTWSRAGRSTPSSGAATFEPGRRWRPSSRRSMPTPRQRAHPLRARLRPALGTAT